MQFFVEGRVEIVVQITLGKRETLAGHLGGCPILRARHIGPSGQYTVEDKAKHSRCHENQDKQGNEEARAEEERTLL